MPIEIADDDQAIFKPEIFMRRWMFAPLLCLAFASCQSGPAPIAQFWRPVSEPNLLMSGDKLQQKLTFDLNQCHCGTYPANASHSDMVQLQPDKQRLAETAITVTPDENGSCIQQPSLVVSECMRQRGWEPTSCSGRVPLAGGGALCAAYRQPD